MYSRNTKTTNQTTANNNKSYAEGILVVFDMGQCEITLKMSPALYQEEEEEIRQTTGI
jgi:dihydroxyacetone kinase DhaKLM complex PTS-EIIA-like component DhaM